jgi:hypothetical protein
MDTKAQLQKLIEQIKTKQFRDGEAQGLTKSVGGEITKQLKPAFEALGKDLTSNISSAIKELKINVPEGKQAQVNVNVPDVIVPDIKVPEPKVTVNIPPFPRIPDFPKIEMPETMKVMGSVEIANNDYTNPLKVQLVDLKNRPYESVGGGGFAGGVKINNSSSEPIPVAGTFVSSAPDSTAAVLINREGNVYNSDNPLPVTVTSGATATTAVNIVDSSGVQYSGSNPMPTYLVAGSGNSTVSVGAVVSDAVDDGSAPNKIGGIARTENPTAVAGGDIVTFSSDKVGRQISRPIQVRELIQTAYATITNGTETTLLAGVASTYLDLVYAMFANSSDAAVLVDIRAGTANGIVGTVNVPASSMAGFSPKVPIPQDVAANTWTVDMPDITGTTVYATALFSKEI